MAEIKQSTSIRCSRQDLLDFFNQSLPLITLNTRSPSIIYHISKVNKSTPSQINWSLYHGVFHIKFTSRITEYKPFESMKSELSSGPFHKWRHEQTIELRGLKTYIHDKIYFTCEDSVLQDIVQGSMLRYQFEVLLEEKSKKATQKIHAIQRKTA